MSADFDGMRCDAFIAYDAFIADWLALQGDAQRIADDWVAGLLNAQVTLTHLDHRAILMAELIAEARPVRPWRRARSWLAGVRAAWRARWQLLTRRRTPAQSPEHAGPYRSAGVP